MKKSKKILTAALFSAMLIGSVGATTVSAAPSSSGTVGGISCSGWVSRSNSSATAITNFPAGGATIEVTAKVCYVYEGQTGSNQASSKASSGGTSATAKMEVKGTVLGGRGTHYIFFNGDDWYATTSDGTVW